MSATNPTQIHATSEATGFIPAPADKGKPITVIGTNSIRAGFDATCLQQALNARGAPVVTHLVLNPDAHAGYGAPVGCVLTSPTHIYPGPVGVDIQEIIPGVKGSLVYFISHNIRAKNCCRMVTADLPERA